MIYKKMTLNEQRNVTLACYRLDSSEELKNASVRPAILVLPGGGYFMCSDREAEPIAMAYLAEGYHAFVLRYSIGEHSNWPNPLDDAEQALALIRKNAADWGVDPQRIAVIGFSAGGHLAASLGILGKDRPNAMLLGYPVILKQLVKRLNTTIPGLEGKTDAQTPPTFIFTTANDTVVAVANTLQLASDLDAQGIPFECHIFHDGAHGLSLAKPHTSRGYREYVKPDVAEWFPLSITWLQQVFGEFSHDEIMPPWRPREE
ncbi:MAG: alpha/beta hydrolase [Anaerolineae bacterium]|jgi:acetyl esterase/lipase|nr:alpha/beta hydrolase [Anaerolineae bacterium]